MDAMPDLPDAVRECHPVDDVTQVPWPDYQGCPYRPYGRFGYWLVFEEPHAKRGHARRQVFLTMKEAREGQLSRLEIDHHLLAAWFPAPADGDDYLRSFDAAKVEAWLHHHANIAETARLNRYEARLRAAGRWPEQPAQACAKAAPAQAPAAAVPHPMGATVSLPGGRGTQIECRTVHVRPTGDGGAMMVVTIHLPMGDDYAVTARLTSQQRTALAHALSAC